MDSPHICQALRAPLAALTLLWGVTVLCAQERVPFPDSKDDGQGPTRSEGGEFVVKGADAYTRGIYCDFGVASRKKFQDLMNLNSRLKFPLVIDLRTVPGNRVRGHPVQPRVFLNHTYNPNIQVALCESFRFADLREELVRFFLMDFSLRNHANVQNLIEKRGDDLIPEWLWAGVSEAIGFREDGEPSELFAAIFQAGTIMSVDEILAADPTEMNSLSRAVYRASAGGLVLTLLQHDAGPARMRNFIDALATAPQDQQALLRKYFPGASDSNNSLEKWWALQAAQLAKPTSLDVLSIAETEEKLKRALTVAYMEDPQRPGGEGVGAGESQPRLPLFGLFIKKRADEPEFEFEPEPSGDFPIEQRRVTYALEEYRNFEGRPDLGDLLHGCELRLVQLSYRSFPLHRPIIKAYLQIIKDIESGDTKGTDAQFAALAETRAGLSRSGQMVEDLMNLEEATSSSHVSGAFDEYLKLFEQLRRSRPVREDEISKYLDRIQAEYK